MSRTRIKICGVTRLEDARLACELGADAIGLVMTPSSPRCVTPECARAIRDALPPFVDAVVVVMDQPRELVETIVRQVNPDFLQFHGDESPETCASYGVAYIKAFGMSRRYVSLKCIADYTGAAGVLFDGRDPARRDAKGGCFDWDLIPDGIAKPVILAGGLNETNIARGIGQVRPFAVDVSSGVESGAGIKDAGMMRRLFEAVRRADESC